MSKLLPQLEIPFQFDSEENFAQFIRETETMCIAGDLKEQSAKPALPLKKQAVGDKKISYKEFKKQNEAIGLFYEKKRLENLKNTNNP